MEDVEQQQLLISQLKDLIRAKDQEVEQKNKLLKDAEAKLSKARLQAKAKDAKIASLSKAKKENGDNSPNDASQAKPTNVNNGHMEQSQKGKMLLQQKKIEEKDQKIVQQQTALKEQEDRFKRMQEDFHNKHAELTKQLKEVSSNRGIDVDQQESKRTEELYTAILTKDQKISDLTSKLDERENQLKVLSQKLGIVQNDLQEKSVMEEQQKLLLDKLSRRLEEKEEQVSMATEDNVEELSEMRSQMEKYRSEMIRLEMKLREKQETVDVKEEQILQMKRENDARILDVQEESIENDQLIKTLKHKLHEQDEVLSGKDKVIELLQLEMADRVQEHDELQKTINILQQNLRENVESKQLLMEEIKNIHSSVHQSSKTSDVQVDQLTRGLQQTSEQNALLLAENETLKENIQDLEEKYSQLQQNLEDSSTQMVAIETALQQKETEMKDAASRFHEQVIELRLAKEEHAKAMEIRMKTVLDQIDTQTKVLEGQTAELHRLQKSASYKDENDELKAKLQTLDGDLQKKLQEITELQSQLALADSSRVNLEKDLEEMKNEVKQQQGKYDEMTEANETGNKQTNKIQMKLEETEKQLAELSEVIQAERNLSEDLKLKNRDLLDENQTLENDKMALGQALTGFQQQNEELTTSIVEQTKKIDNLVLEVANAQKNENILQETISMLSDEKVQLSADKLSLKNEVSQLKEESKSNLSHHQEEIRALMLSTQEVLAKEAGEHKMTMKLLDEKELSLSKTSETLANREDEIKSLHDDLNELKCKIDLLENEKQQWTDLEDNLTNENNQLKSENQNISEQLHMNQERCKVLQSDLDNMAQDANTLKDRCQDLEQKVVDLHNLKDQLQAEIVDANAKFVKMESEYGLLTESLSKEKVETGALKTQLADMQRVNVDLENSLKQNELRINEGLVEKEKLVASFEDVKKLLNMKVQDLESSNTFLLVSNEQLTKELSTALKEKQDLHLKLEVVTNANDETMLITEVSHQNRVSDLVQQIDILKSKQTEMEAAILKQSDDWEAKLESVQEENTLLKSAKSDAANVLQEHISEKEMLEMQLEKARSDLQHLSGEKSANSNQLQQQIHSLMEEAEVSSQMIDQLNDLNKELAASNELLGEKVQELEAANLSSTREIENLNHQLEEEKQSQAQILTQLEAAQEMRQKLDENVRKLEVEKLQLAAEGDDKIKGIENEKNDFHKKFAEKVNLYEAEIAALKENILSSTAQHETLCREKADLGDENSLLKKDLATQAQELLDLENKTQMLERDLVQSNENLEALKKHSNVRDDDVSKLSEELLLKDNQLIELKQKYNKTAEELQSIVHSKSDLDEETQDLGSELQEKQSLVESLREELDSFKTQALNEKQELVEGLLGKEQLLQEVTVEYSRLQTELDASRVEFERWKEEEKKIKDESPPSELVQQRDSALARASELEDHMAQFEKIILGEMMRFVGSAKYDGEIVDADNGLHHAIVSYFEHHSQLESKLVEAEDKLQEMQYQMENNKQNNYSDSLEESLGGLGLEESPRLNNQEHERQGVEYLQMQLEDLAHEQESQMIEYTQTTARLNEIISRLKDEKQHLLEAFEKQSESLNDVLKRYEEKDSEWNRLSKLVEEQQHHIVAARAQQENSETSSEKSSQQLKVLEDKLDTLQLKYTEKMEELSIMQNEKEKCEFEIPELKSKLKSLRNENDVLIEQLKQNATTIESMRQELDHAIESSEATNYRHQEEIERLKSLLRDKDTEISQLSEDLGDQTREYNSLSQSMMEKCHECEELNDNLSLHQEKVSSLETELRDRDTELVALSQQHEGAVEQVQIRAKDLAEYVSKLEERVKEKTNENETMNTEVESLRSETSKLRHELEISSKQLHESEENFNNKLYVHDEKYQELLHDYDQMKAKYKMESTQDKEKFDKLQEKYNMQVRDVSALTSHLEEQIQEAAQHHQGATSHLEEEMRRLQSSLNESNSQKARLQEDLEKSNNEVEHLKQKIVELESMKSEILENEKLIENLKATSSLLEERLSESTQLARSKEQLVEKLTSELSDTTQRLDERNELVKKFGEEITKITEEKKTLKEALQSESERQLNELNYMVESRLSERDQQVQAVNEQVTILRGVVKQKDDELLAVKSSSESQALQMKDEITKLTQQCNDLQATISDLQASNNDLENSIKSLQDETERKEQSWMKTSLDLEEKLRVLNESSNNSLLESSRNEEEVKNLTEQLNKSKSEAEAALKDQASKHEAQKEKAKKIVRAQQIQMKHVKEEKEKLSEEVKTLAAQLEEMKVSNIQSQQVLEESLQKKENDGQEKMQSLVAQNVELEQELLASQKKTEESETLVSSMKEQLLTLMSSSQEELQVKEEMLSKVKAEFAALLESKSKEQDLMKEQFSQSTLELQGKADEELAAKNEMLSTLKKEFSSLLESTNKEKEEWKLIQDRMMETLEQERKKFSNELQSKDLELDHVKTESASLVASLDKEKEESDTKLKELLQSADEEKRRIVEEESKRQEAILDKLNRVEAERQRLIDVEEDLKIKMVNLASSNESLKQELDARSQTDSHQVVQLNERVSLLEEAVKNLKSENEGLQTQASDAIQLKEEVASQLVETKRHAEENAILVEQHKEALSSYSERISEKEKQLEELEHRLHAKDEEVHSVVHKLDELSHNLTNNQLQLQETLTSLKEKEKEKLAYEDSLNEMENKLRISEEEGKVLQESLRSTVKDLSSSLKEARDEAFDLRNKSGILEEEVRERETTLEALRNSSQLLAEESMQKSSFNDDEVEKMKIQMKELISQINSQEEIIAACKRDLEESHGLSKSLQDSLNEGQETISTRTQQIEAVSHEITALKEQLASANERNSDLQQALNKQSAEEDVLRQELASLLKQVEVIHHEKGELESLLQEKKSEIATILSDAESRMEAKETQFNELTERSGDLECECSRLNDVNTETRCKVEELLNELTSKKEEVAEITRMLEKERKQRLQEEEDARLRIQDLEDVRRKNEDESKHHLEEELMMAKEMFSQSQDRLSSSQENEEKMLEKCRKLEDELEACDHEISNLAGKLEKSMSDFESFQAQLMNLQQEKQELEKNKDAFDLTKTKIQTLESEVAQLKQKSTELQETLAQRDDTIKQMQKQKDETSDTKNGSDGAKLAAVEKQLSDTQRKLKASLVSRKSVMAKLKDAETRAGVAEKLNESLNEEKSNLEARLNESINSSQAEFVNESFQHSSVDESRLNDLQGEINDLRDQQMELERQNKQLFEEKSALCQEKSSLHEAVKEHELRCSELQQQITSFESLQRKLAGDNDTVQREKVTLEGAIKSLEEKLHNKDLLISNLENSLNDIKAEKQNLSALHEGSAQGMQEQMNQMASASKALQEELDAAKDELRSKGKEIFELTSDLASAIDRREALEAQLETLKKEHSDESESQQNTIRELENKLQSAEELKKDNETQAGLLGELERTRSELQASVNRAKHLEEELLQQETLHGQLQTQFESTTQQLEVISNERFNLNSAINEIEDKMAGEIGTLQAEIQKLNQEKVEIADQNTLFQSETEHVLQSLRDENKKLKDENNSYQEQITESQTKVQTSKSETENLKSHLNAYKEEINMLQANIVELKNSHKLAEESHQRAAQEQEALQKSDAEEKMTQLQRKLKAALVSRKELLTSTKKLEEELCAVRKQNTEAEQKIKQLTSSFEEKEIRLAQVEDKVVQLKNMSSISGSNLQQLQEENRKLSEEKTKLMKQMQEEKDRITNLEAEVGTLQTCNQDMNEMVVAMETRTSKMEKTLAERTEALRSAQKCIRKLEKTLGQGEATVQETSALKIRIKELEEGNEVLISKCESLDGEKREKVMMLEKLMKDFEEQSLEKDEVTHRYEDLQSQLERVKSASDADDAVTLLADFKMKQQTLEEENSVLQAKCAEMENTLYSSVTESSSELLENLQRENEHKATLITDLREKIVLLEEEIAEKKLVTTTSEMQSLVQVEVEKESLQQSPPKEDDDEEHVTRARRELIDETLKQLKATQPDMWEQEPGIKKLIDKLEEVAKKAASHKKFAEEMLLKFTDEETKSKDLKNRLKESEKEALSLKEAAGKRESEMKILQEDKNELEKIRAKCEALQRDCDHLNSAFQVEKESYEQVQKRLEKENALIREKLRERRRSESTAVQRLHSLEEEERASQSRCSQLQDHVKELEEQLDSMKKIHEVEKTAFTDAEELLKSEVADGASRLREVEDEAEGLREEIRKLAEEVETITDQRNNAENRLEKLTERMTEEAEALQLKVDQLSEQKTQADGEIQSLRAQVESNEAEITELRESLENITSNTEILETSLVEKNKELNDLDFALKENVRKVGFLEKSLEEKREESERIINESLQRSEDSMAENLKHEVEVHHAELKKREQLVSELVSDCKRLRTELSSALSENQTLSADVTDLFSQVQSLGALKTQYEANENHLKSELAEKDKVIHRQQEEVDETREEHKNLLRSVGAGSVSDISNMLVAYLDDIRRLKLDVRSRNEQIGDLELDIETLKTEKEELEAEKDALSHASEDTNKTLAEKLEIIQELEVRLAGNEGNFSILEEDIAESRKRWEEEKTRFIMSSDEQEETIKELNEVVAKYEQDVAALEEQVIHEDSLRSMILNLQEQLDERDTESETIEKRIKDLSLELMRDGSVFQKIVYQAPQPPLTQEALQQATENSDRIPKSAFDDLKFRLKQIEDALDAKERAMGSDVQEHVRILQEQITASDHRLQAQTSQLQVAVEERDSLHSQVVALNQMLQQYQGQYQAQYNNLHAEYQRTVEEVKRLTHEISMAKQPSNTDVASQDELKLVNERLEEAMTDKEMLEDRISNLEEQLQEEISRRLETDERCKREVEEAWRQQGDHSTSINMSHVFSDEDEAVLLKPSFKRKVSRSKAGLRKMLCGRSLLRSHVRPYSMRALIGLYLLLIHIFTIKCLAGL